ncbi:MAG: FAD-dependent oxidoreductase [Clostridia bacterium]|nr:FAD-dependent oxidoreductase [Clostridia bacterium]
MNSIWTESVKKPSFETLQGDVKTDVLIIGGGLAGILCAHMLENAGVDYLLVEADSICGGVTQNTTAKITIQHGLVYEKLSRRYGTEGASIYLAANLEALEKYRNLCEGIDCNFEEKDAFVYSLCDRGKIEAEAEAYQKLGVPARVVSELPLPFPVKAAVQVSGQAQFHPLKFAYNIAKNLRIMEHTKVRELKPGTAVCNNGTIKAEKIIIATHFPIINKHGGYFIKLYQNRSYVIALKNAPDLKGMYVDEADKGLSFRNYGNLLLLGGGSHRTGKKGGNWKELSDFARLYYPDSEEVVRFATQDCMSLDSIPYIGRYSKCSTDLYVATGFNKWGMTSSMVSAMILSDLVQGKENMYSDLFSPTRSVLHTQLFINGFESVMGLITPTVPRCPHLGCALKYNKEEHSWDCPCHGSRFTESGQLIENPSTDDLRRHP